MVLVDKFGSPSHFQSKDMPFSHHSHSGQFCKHASGYLEDVVKEAIHQGFEVYGLTEHAPRYRLEDLYPEEVRNETITELTSTMLILGEYQSRRAIATIHRLRK